MSAPSPRPGAALLPPATDRDYLWIPTHLLDSLYDSPLAIGLYALIARRWLADGRADGVPLSDGDIARYDPQLSSRGALVRAISRLDAAGWIITVRTRGAKTRYTPAWGRLRSGVRPWSTTAPSLGRGRVQTIRVARRLLDDYLGRLIPHARVPAQVERYQTSPTIGLKDIGVYILRQRGREAPAAPALEAARLCMDATPLVVPPTQETLARAELSVQGMRRVGLLPVGPQPCPGAPDRRPPLFFVGVGMIGHMIGHMIGQSTPDQAGFRPAEWAKPALQDDHADATGMQGMQGIENPPTPVETTGKRGAISLGQPQETASNEQTNLASTTQPARCPRRPRREQGVMSIPATPGTQRLLALGVRPAQVRELAEVPLECIEAAIADAQDRPAIRDQAAWVVSLLRDVRDHGWDLTVRTRGAVPENAGPSLAQIQASIERAKASGGWIVEADAPALECTSPLVPPLSDATAAALRRAKASGFFGARETPPADDSAAAAALEERGDTAEIGLPAPSTVMAGPTSSPGPTRRAVGTESPVSPLLDDRRPAWIAPTAWADLPVVLRGVLRGARLVDAAIVTTDAWQQRQLARFPDAVARLLSSAEDAGHPLPPPGLCYNGGHDGPDDGRS